MAVLWQSLEGRSMFNRSGTVLSQQKPSPQRPYSYRVFCSTGQAGGEGHSYLVGHKTRLDWGPLRTGFRLPSPLQRNRK